MPPPAQPQNTTFPDCPPRRCRNSFPRHRVTSNLKKVENFPLPQQSFAPLNPPRTTVLPRSILRVGAGCCRHPPRVTGVPTCPPSHLAAGTLGARRRKHFNGTSPNIVGSPGFPAVSGRAAAVPARRAMANSTSSDVARDPPAMVLVESNVLLDLLYL